MLGTMALAGHQAPELRHRAAYKEETRTERLCLLSDSVPFSRGPFLVSIEGTISRFRGVQMAGGGASLEESVLDLFLSEGESFVKKLEGLFLVLIHNRETGDLYLFNNPYQTTTLYWYHSSDRLVFSKFLTDIVRNTGGQVEVALGSVKTYLANGFNMADETTAKGIRKLLPTFWIHVQGNQVSLKNHWRDELSFERKPFQDLERHLDEYERLFQTGIREYAQQYHANELGCLMSGGHDTSFCFIQGAKAFGKPLHAFTATFPGWAFNEESHSRNICEKFGGKFHAVPFQASDLDYLVGMVRALEEPMASSALPIHLVMKEAAKHVDLMMGGDGGDTLWAEYHPVAEVNRYIRNLPLPARTLLHKMTQGLLKVSDWEHFWELEHVASLFTQEDPYAHFLRRLCTYRHFRDDLLRDLMDPQVYQAHEYAGGILEVSHGKETLGEDLIASKLFNGFYPYMSFYTTKSAEYYGMDLYLPTVHRDIIKFITSLPHEWVNGGTTLHRLTNSKKYNRKFHKAALARYLRPEEIRNLSFDIPWYRILLPRPQVLDLLLERLVRRGWFNPRELRKLFQEFRSQPVNENLLLELKNHGYRIFTLLSLEIWCIEYLDGRLTTNPDGRIKLEDYLA